MHFLCAKLRKLDVKTKLNGENFRLAYISIMYPSNYLLKRLINNIKSIKHIFLNKINKIYAL